MDFGANKTPVEVIREGAFGGKYFRDKWEVVQKVMVKPSYLCLYFWGGSSETHFLREQF